VRSSEPKETPGAERYSIAIEVHGFTEISAQVSVFIFRDFYRGKLLTGSDLVRKIDFDSSYFSTPYVDNTLIGRDRFSLIYQGCYDSAKLIPCTLAADANPIAQFQVVVFDQEFMSQKEGPYIDEVVEKVAE
jgi:hypothetical protein